MCKKIYGYAVYSSMLGGIMAAYSTRLECDNFIKDYYAEYGRDERLTILNNYPL